MLGMTLEHLAPQAKSERPPKSRNVQTMRLNAGLACLDLLNTRAFRSGTPREWLNHLEDLLSFAQRTGILEPGVLEAWGEWTRGHPQETQGELEKLRTWRETLYRSVLGAGTPGDLEQLNATLSEACGYRHLVQHEGVYAWHWGTDAPAVLRWTLALEAAELLVSGRASRVRSCPGHHCGWVFLDAGRGKTRRWCDMALCGNRDKVRQHRTRLGQARAEGAAEAENSSQSEAPRTKLAGPQGDEL